MEYKLYLIVLWLSFEGCLMVHIWNVVSYVLNVGELTAPTHVIASQFALLFLEGSESELLVVRLKDFWLGICFICYSLFVSEI